MLQAVVGRSGDDAIRAMSKAYIQFVREHPPYMMLALAFQMLMTLI
nr:hypothetical protein [Lysinibacillus sphaericus]